MPSSRLAKTCAATLALGISAAWTWIFPAFALVLTGVPLREDHLLIIGCLIAIWALVICLIIEAAAEFFFPQETHSARHRSFLLFLDGLKPRRETVRRRNRRIRL